MEQANHRATLLEMLVVSISVDKTLERVPEHGKSTSQNTTYMIQTKNVADDSTQEWHAVINHKPHPARDVPRRLRNP